MNVDIYNSLPPVLPRCRITSLNENVRTSESNVRPFTTTTAASSSSSLPSSSTFTLNTPTETTVSPLSTHLSDIVTCIAEMLTLDDLRSLVCTNKDWSTCFNVSRYMHTLRFTDLHLSSSLMTTTATPPSIVSPMTYTQPRPCDLPEPDQMIRLSRLDLTGYIHTGSPARTKIRVTSSRHDRSGPPNRSSTVPSSTTSSLATTVTSSTVSSLMNSPNNRNKYRNDNVTQRLLESSSNVLQRPTTIDSMNLSEDSSILIPRSVTLSTELPYTVPDELLLSSPSPTSTVLSPQTWLSKFLNHKPSCYRLQVLKCSTTVPRYLQEYLFQQCTNIRSLSLRSCEMTDDTLLMKIQAKYNLRAIDLNNCWRLTDEGIEYLLRTCPNMEKALLEGVWKLTDNLIDQIPTYWAKLSVLELTGSHHNISYIGIMNLLIKHKKLRALRLSNMHFDSGNNGWNEIFRACIYAVQNNSLQVIEISQAPYLSNATLEYYYDQVQQENSSVPLQVIIKSCLGVTDNNVNVKFRNSVQIV